MKSLRVLFLFLYPLVGVAAQHLEVRTEKITGIEVSPLLVGANIIYSHEDGREWNDGEKVRILKESGIQNLRYPEGHQVSFWDWEFPYHEAYEDIWNPRYEKKLSPKRKAKLKAKYSNRLGLDQFLSICEESGVEPIIGINMFQGYKYDRIEESIAKAVKLVRYCKSKSPKNRYYFLDNEAGHQPAKNNHIPISAYIKLIPQYSKAIKEADPEAQIIANVISWGKVEALIRDAGAYVDIYEHHWYYSNRKWGEFYLEDWRAEAFDDEQAKRFLQFNEWKTTYGQPHLKFGLLEWNLGPAKAVEGATLGNDLYQGLVQADMLIQMIRNDVFMASMWPLTWKSRTKKSEYRNLINSRTGEVSPSQHIFSSFAKAAKGRVLEVDRTSTLGLSNLTVLSPGRQSVMIYFINKTPEEKSVDILIDRPVASVQKLIYRGRGHGLTEVDRGNATVGGNRIHLLLPDTSFAFLEVKLSGDEKVIQLKEDSQR
ncbi:hypothetical protein [Pelagicoccus mobilis]|uniref:Alpha-L-arabinofuranosidase 1 catalytic domain-containing protein n=1 Tax=Pelagicoccus mobilis TaxID=415221 RepID=A0A934VJQ1_9BACT|nr:hypothetical protein [Pelagicoccus mobilis]MBK1875856.1 hypothetical protein [Pelagicoccus mobilis]